MIYRNAQGPIPRHSGRFKQYNTCEYSWYWKFPLWRQVFRRKTWNLKALPRGCSYRNNAKKREVLERFDISVAGEYRWLP